REAIEDFAGCGGAMIAELLATRLPGPGTTYVEQTLRFRRPVTIGEAITATVTATAKNAATSRVTFECRRVNQAGAIVVDGNTEVVAPAQKMSRAEPARQHEPGARHRRLIEATRGLEPLKTAVVHPVDRNSLLGAIDAARAGLIVPVLVGPEAKIRGVAAAESLDLSPYRDIVQNAIDLARVLGVETPKVAILSAVETLNPEIASTLDAAALCKMADRKQITGGILDGPLAFDNAISEEAARVKGIESLVAGRADVLVVP